MTLSSDDWAVRRLNTHSFETIWNGAPGEYTVNVALSPIGQRYALGVVILGNQAYPLPDSDPFMVFTVPYQLFGNSQLFVSNQWIAADTILAQVQTLLSVYTDSGVQLPRNAVYLYRAPGSQLALVAIRFAACFAFFPTGMPRLYITAYRNPRTQSPIQSQSFLLPTPLDQTSLTSLQTAIAGFVTQSALGTFLTVNGYDLDPTLLNFPTWKAGDYVDLLFDPSVIAAYDAEVMTLNSGYMSIKYNGIRDILHCPKADNPNQWILTHEASYVSIWDSATRRGVRVPRLDPHCIEQISHADWSISRNVVGTLKASLGATTVLARVRVRQPAEPHTLQPNSGMLQSLYEFSDLEITENMLGNVDAAATFWLAEALEQNPYVSLMFATPQGTDTAILSLYRDALGYHDMVGVLGESVQTNLKAAQSVILTKPPYLYPYSCEALVFLNGRKIDSAAVTVKDLHRGRLAISVASTIPIQASDRFDVTLLENAPFTAMTITNAAIGTIATIPTPYASVYEYITFTTPMLGWDGSTLLGGYSLIAPGSLSYQLFPAATGTGYDVAITSALVGKTLLVIDDIYVSTDRIALDSALSVADALIFPLQGADGQSNLVPLLNAGTVEVYLNGRILAPSLDYNLLPWTDPVSGAVGRIDVVVANQSYLGLGQTGNRLEIIAHSGKQSSRDVSYVLGSVLRHQVTPSFWNPKLSRLFVEGLWVDDAIWHTGWLAVSGQPEGGVGYWDTTIHRRLYELMLAYEPFSDYGMLTVVDKMMNHITPALPAMVVQTSQHHLYSPYLSAIIADVANGTLILIDDPDPRQFLQQFQAYAALKRVDPALATYAGPVNLDYVAVAADYTNYTIDTPSTYSLIQRLISYVLTPSVTLGETLI